MTKPAFRSNDYTFRPTSLGQRLAEAGLVKAPHLVREAKLEVISGHKHTVLSVAA